MKFLILLILPTLAFAQAWHGRDSVGVFYTPKKVSVLIGEIFNPKRLHLLWDSAGLDGDTMIFSSKDKSLEVKCFRDLSAADCKFFFAPSEFISIVPRQAAATFPLDQLSVQFREEVDLHFKSANGDTFDVKIADGQLLIIARKK